MNSHPAQLSEAIARVRAHTEQKKDESGRLRSRMAYARLMHSIDAIAMQKRAIDSLLPTIEGDEKAEELKDELIKEMIKSKCHRIGDEAATFKRYVFDKKICFKILFSIVLTSRYILQFICLFLIIVSRELKRYYSTEFDNVAAFHNLRKLKSFAVMFRLIEYGDLLVLVQRTKYQEQCKT